MPSINLVPLVPLDHHFSGEPTSLRSSIHEAIELITQMFTSENQIPDID